MYVCGSHDVWVNMGMINIEIRGVTNRRNSNSSESRASFHLMKHENNYLGVLLVIVLLRTNPSRNEIVLDTM